MLEPIALSAPIKHRVFVFNTHLLSIVDALIFVLSFSLFTGTLRQRYVVGRFFTKGKP